MASIPCKALVVIVAALTMAVTTGLASPAFANQGGDYAHSIFTDQSNPYIVCGNHICGTDELPHPPKAVEPVGTH